MGKQQAHFEFDEYLWKQFQALYPRQARRTFEDMMRSMISLKLEVSDEEGEQMKSEREELQKKCDVIQSCLKEHDMKIRIWEAKKREELAKQKQELERSYKEASIQGKAIRASGILERVRIQ